MILLLFLLQLAAGYPTSILLPNPGPKILGNATAWRKALAPPPTDDLFHILNHGSLNDFPSLQQADDFLSTLLSDFPQYISRLLIGESIERRSIFAYRIASPSIENKWTDTLYDPFNKTCLKPTEPTFNLTDNFSKRLSELAKTRPPRILLTALHHAREPASLTSVLFFVGRILQLGTTSPKIRIKDDYEAEVAALARHLLTTTEIILVPFVNPDGYEAVRLTQDRSIRKNRRKTCHQTISRSPPENQGVDLNRNYAFHFGTTHHSCDPQEYEGEFPFSEPETRAIRCLISAGQFGTALNFHTFGNVWTHPFNCCTNIKLPQKIKDIYDEVKRSIQVPEFGSAPNLKVLNYTTSGEADDWMLGHHGVLAFSPEVGAEEFGFFPPQKEILSMSKNEFWHIASVALKTGYELMLTLRALPIRNDDSYVFDVTVANTGLSPYSLEGKKFVFFRHLQSTNENEAPTNGREFFWQVLPDNYTQLPMMPFPWSLSAALIPYDEKPIDPTATSRQMQRLRRHRRERRHVYFPNLDMSVIEPRSETKPFQVKWDNPLALGICFVEEKCLCTFLSSLPLATRFVSPLRIFDSNDELCVAASSNFNGRRISKDFVPLQEISSLTSLTRDSKRFPIGLFVAAEIILSFFFVCLYYAIVSLEDEEEPPSRIGICATQVMLWVSKSLCCFPCCLKYNMKLRRKKKIPF